MTLRVLSTGTRMVYGGDTNRYFMLRHALDAHKVLFLFDGADEPGFLGDRVERCITGLVALDHRVVATARLQEEMQTQDNSTRSVSGRMGDMRPAWLKTSPQLFRALELLPLETECRKSLVEVVLRGGSTDDVSAATEFCEDFIMSLDDDEWRRWSTPMMVSIITASWREKRRNEAKKMNKDSGRQSSRIMKDKDSENAVINSTSTSGNAREVYRVALDLMLRRFQSKQQADRHKLKETIQNFKELLELIAVDVSKSGRKEFTDDSMMPLLARSGIDVQIWKDLSQAIAEGRVPLLQTRKASDENGSVSYMFVYPSFQTYLSSTCSRRDEATTAQPAARQGSHPPLLTPRNVAQATPNIFQMMFEVICCTQRISGDISGGTSARSGRTPRTSSPRRTPNSKS